MRDTNRNKIGILVGSILTLVVAAVGLLRPIVIGAAVLGLLVTAVPLLYASTKVRNYIRWLFSRIGGR